MKNYLEKRALYTQLIKEKPNKNLEIIVVIPCFNEPDLIKTLNSLWSSQRTEKKTEIIIVINSSEKSSLEIIEKNQQTYDETKVWISQHKDDNLSFYLINEENLPKKFAGVGLARKIGMDEAVRRFVELEKDGIIVGFDADSLCEKNYLTEIEKTFRQNPKTNAASIYFEHPLEGEEFSSEVYKRILQYDLYLRYYIHALRYAGLPYAYHTIGSSFAVKASVYAKQGGMNRRKAGEDFYFLQKIIPLGNYKEINSTKVIPSPRPSDRVPFGTGAAVEKLLADENPDYLTYNPDAFVVLKEIFDKRIEFFQIDKQLINQKIKELKSISAKFLIENNFEQDLIKINTNSPNVKIFDKRFFDWFNAFRALKFLNFLHEKEFEKISIEKAANILLLKIKEENIEYNFTEIELIKIYRKMDLQEKKI